MLLQGLLFRSERNWPRRWSKFGNDRTIQNCSRRRCGSAAIVVCKNTLSLRYYSRRGSDHLSLAHGPEYNAEGNARDRITFLKRGAPNNPEDDACQPIA